MLIKRRETVSGVVVVELFGRFELTDKTAFLAATKIEANQKLIVDLTLLNHLTLEGVQMLTSLVIQAGQVNEKVAFVDSRSTQVNQKIATTGVDLILNFFAGTDEAVNALLAT